MRFHCQLRCRKNLFLKPGSCFETVLQAIGQQESSQARHTYPAGASLSAGSQLASFDAGTDLCHAAEPEVIQEKNSLVFELRTNAILDPGILGEYLSLHTTSAAGQTAELPLSSPGLELVWLKRGCYRLTVGLPA